MKDPRTDQELLQEAIKSPMFIHYLIGWMGTNQDLLEGARSFMENSKLYTINP